MKKLFISFLIAIICFIPFQLNANNYIGSTIIDNHIIYDVFFDSEISSPSFYRDLTYFLEIAKKEDVFLFHINTMGGDLLTAIQLFNNIQNTNAITIADIYVAFSAGSMIAMACDKVIINKFALMMIHSFIVNGISGSITEINPYINFLNNQNSYLLKEIYKGFLSKTEIQEIENNKVLWLEEKEIKKRFEKMNKILK
jgi:ATP-dependent protease ClpP protease subunit